jgi:hypothetical protein
MAKLVRHLVAHTIGSLKPFVWAWLAVLAYQTWALWMGPDDPSLPPAPGLDLAVSGLILRIALTVVFATQVVFRHPLVGTTAFWQTRPIPRSALLLSTLATVALVLVVVPFVWFLGVSLWFGLDAGTALRAALVIATEQLVASGLALAVASVTRNLAQGIVVSIAIVVGTYLTPWLLFSRVPMRRQYLTPFTLESAESAVAIVVTLVALIVVAVTAHQHLTLRTRRTRMLIAGLVVVLPVLYGRFALWSIKPSVSRPPVSSAIVVPELELDSASVQWDLFTRTGPSVRQSGIRYTALMRESGPGSDAVTLRPLTLLATLRFENGIEERFSSDAVELREEEPAVGSPTEQTQPLSSVAATTGGAAIVDPPGFLQRRFRTTFFEQREMTSGFNRVPATAFVSVVCEASRYMIAARTMLAVGSRVHTPGLAIEIESVVRAASELMVTLRETRRSVRHEARGDVFLLYNQRRAEAAVFERIGSTTSRSAFPFSNGLAVTRLQLSATAPGARPVFDNDWLADAEILVLQRQALGTVARNLRLRGLFLEPRSARAGDRR